LGIPLRSIPNLLPQTLCYDDNQGEDMSTREYSGESIKIENLTTCFKALMGIIGPDEVLFAEEFLSDETYRGLNQITNRLDKIQHLSKNIIFKFRTKNKKDISITIFRRYKLILLIISDAEKQLEEKLTDLIQNLLELKEPTELDRRSDASEPNIYKLLWNIFDDVQKIKDEISLINQKALDDKNKLLGFVSFRFDDHSKSLAFELKEFLDKVNVNLISGIGYEPRPVSEKVLQRLSSPLDLFIIIGS